MLGHGPSSLGTSHPHPVLDPSACICFPLWAYLCPYPNQQGGPGPSWGHNPFWEEGRGLKNQNLKYVDQSVSNGEAKNSFLISYPAMWIEGCTWHRVGISDYAYAIAESLPSQRRSTYREEECTQCRRKQRRERKQKHSPLIVLGHKLPSLV